MCNSFPNKKNIRPPLVKIKLYLRSFKDSNELTVISY